MQGRLKYFAAASVAAALWGFMSIPLRAIQQWPSEDILYYRIFVSTALIWPFILLFRRKKLNGSFRYLRSVSPAHRKRLAALSIITSLLIMANWFTFIYAVNQVSIQSAAFAYLVCPLLTTVAAFFILKERLTGIKKVAIAIALVSVILLARGSLYDVVWSVGIASFYALYLVIQRMIQQVDRLFILAVQLTLCSLFILPLLLTQHHPVPDNPVFWTNITAIAIVFTIVPLYLSLYALNGVSSSTVGVLIYINPIIAFVIAITYFNEPVHNDQLAAYLVLFFAVFLFNWGALQKVFHKFAWNR